MSVGKEDWVVQRSKCKSQLSGGFATYIVSIRMRTADMEERKYQNTECKITKCKNTKTQIQKHKYAIYIKCIVIIRRRKTDDRYASVRDT